MNKEEQFNKIVADNKERISRICGYYNSNKHDRQDMFQEILINIWKSLERFRGESAIDTWIYRIAVNTAIAYSGKLNRSLKFLQQTEPQSMDFLLDDDCSEETRLKEEQFEKMEQELNMLSIIDKTIMLLALEELSYKEIADVIGITEPNVRVKIHRIKSQLKIQLKEDNYGNNS